MPCCLNTPTSTLGLSINLERCQWKIELPHGASWNHPKHLPTPAIIVVNAKAVPQLCADLSQARANPLWVWVDPGSLGMKHHGFDWFCNLAWVKSAVFDR